MMIEALRPLHIRRAAGDIHLLAGMRAELPADDVAKLLDKAPGRVRVMAGFQIGQIVEWDSRMFYGLMAATVLDVTAQDVRVVHPLTGEEALIPQGWLTVRT